MAGLFGKDRQKDNKKSTKKNQNRISTQMAQFGEMEKGTNPRLL